MRIGSANLGAVQQKYFQSLTQARSYRTVENVKQKLNVDTFERESKTEEIFSKYGFKVDQNTKKELQSFSWEEWQGQLSLERWQEKKAQYGDSNSFAVYSDAQHLVFTQKLCDMGAFDGKSEEEKSKMERLLFDITSMMSCVGENKIGASRVATEGTGRYYCYEGEIITMQKYDESLYGVTSDMVRVGLESAKAALETFSSKYLTEDQQAEFSEIIDEFYYHNAEYLEEYKAFGEDVSKFAANFQKSGLRDVFDQEGLIGVHNRFSNDQNDEDEYTKILSGMNHTQEENEIYMAAFSAMFKLMQQTENDFSKIWSKIRDSYTEYITEGNALIGLSDGFTHMEKYWSELLEN